VRVQRKVGAVRTEGRADGLTKAQAERVLRRVREIESPRSAPDGQRVTMEQSLTVARMPHRGAQLISSCARSEALGGNLPQETRGLIG
jgi:hypothetical protein